MHLAVSGLPPLSRLKVQMHPFKKEGLPFSFAIAYEWQGPIK
jgi:hypothetical protein